MKIVFSFDAAFFKPESGFSGQLLNMSGIDCNGKCIPIAFAIVPVQASPSAEEYEERMEKFAKKSHDAAVEYLRKVERNWILYQHI